MSLGDPRPNICSVSSPMPGNALAALPASAFWRSTWLNAPTPPSVTSVVASRARGNSAGPSSDAPPGLVPRISTSSARKSVGLRMTLTPFDSVQFVTPTSGTRDVATMVAAVGARATSGRDALPSSYAARSRRLAESNTASSWAALGTVTPAFSGAFTAMTRLRWSSHAPARRFTSASVMTGTSRCASGYSYSMPGIASLFTKLRMYSPARVDDWRFSRSANVRSYDRSRFCFARSSSVAVKPCFCTRTASPRTASSPRSTPPSGTNAVSVNASRSPRNVLLPPPAPMNGASGFWRISSRRSLSIMLNSDSVRSSR